MNLSESSMFLEYKGRSYVPDIRTVSWSSGIKVDRTGILSLADSKGSHSVHVDISHWSSRWQFVRTSMAHRNWSTCGWSCETHRCITEISGTLLQTKSVTVLLICSRRSCRILAGPSHMPFVRSYDENNGRVVYNYAPETCGYVSETDLTLVRTERRCCCILVHAITHRRQQRRLSTSSGAHSKSWGYHCPFRIAFRKWQSDESGASVR